MSDLFRNFINIVSQYGEVTDAHFYDFHYITATVRTDAGKTLKFTVDIGEDENND